MAEESPNNHAVVVKPGKAPARTTEELRKLAGEIFLLRGEPPYTQEQFPGLLEGERNLISDFMIHWRPFMVLEKK